MQTKPNINSRQGNAPSLFDFDDEGNPTGFWFSDKCRRVLGYETEEGLPGNGGSSDRLIVLDGLARINSEFRIVVPSGL